MPSATERRKHRKYQSRSPTVEAVSGLGNVDDSELLDSVDEHRPMEIIRAALRQYQLQSPAHFELELEVHQLASAHSEQIHASTASIDVLFKGYTAEGPISIPGKCHITMRRRRTKAGLWKCTAVNQDQSMEAFEHFFSSKFPIIDAPLRQDTVWRWWLDNGKKFNWINMPTELKERIIEFCMHQPHGHGIYTEKLTRFERRYKADRKIQKIGPFEIVDQLGDWYQLLYVSHQVRTITLRLCITGGSSLTHSKGLCITASSYRSFSERINRLGDYYQMIEPDSVPTTSNEEALSKCYRRFPHICPDLKQYATFRHGIQKISLGMDFLSFMHFLKVKAGGFQLYQKSRGLTYHVFERLPNLNEIVLRLPLRPREGWKHNPHTGGPQLFHDESPCPRSLHRVIFERVAEVLASYNKVTVRNFIDEEEKRRYELARLEAVSTLKFTKIELEELYADDGGGVELSGQMEREVDLPKTKSVKVEVRYPEHLQDEFFPPLCHCDEPCVLSLVLGASEHY